MIAADSFADSRGAVVPARRRLRLTRGRGGGDPLARPLGPWCLTADEVLRTDAQAEVIRFHWDDRDKLSRDYAYLKELHARVLDALAAELNRIHGVRHSRRYWQILADPWLLSYLSTCFDRWEALRMAFADGESFQAIECPLAEPRPPFDYNAFIVAAFTDTWNEWLFGRILEFQYSGRCALQAVPVPTEQTKTVAPSRWTKWLAQRLDRWLAPFSTRSRVTFLQSYFSPAALFRLSLRLRQIPRSHLHDFPTDVPAREIPPREAPPALANFEPVTDFERFLSQRLPRDIPACLVEEYVSLARYSKSVHEDPDVIVTATGQFTNTMAKAWFAERVAAGAALVVVEHGGSFPAAHELLNFEEDISDRRVSWFTPYHDKHVQLPPSKLVGARRRGRNPDGPLLIVGNECSPWVYRAHFYPMAHQCLRSFRMTCELIDALPADALRVLRIRPAPDQGWNTGKLFADRFGAERVSRKGSLGGALAFARLIVCTYPETTFSEAMASDVPTILVYPPEFYERHPVTRPLVEQLRAARMLFNEAGAAAEQVATVWRDPLAWWQSEDVRAARRAWRDTAMRIDGDWASEWTAFLRSFGRDRNQKSAAT